MFKHFKSNGFDLQAINLGSGAKSNLMMVIMNLAISYLAATLLLKLN